MVAGTVAAMGNAFEVEQRRRDLFGSDVAS